MGGDRHHPLVVAIADGLEAQGITAVRPDLPDPNPEPSAVALEEVAAGLLAETGAERLFLVGYSWGSVVTSIATPDHVAARVLIAPPVSMLTPREGNGVPALVLVPEHDQYGGPEAVFDAMGEWPATMIETVAGADHFLAGAVSDVARRTVEWLSARP